jgi:hypothetical protein
MRADTRKLWPLVVALGTGFALLNLGELVLLESGGSEIVGLAIGAVVAALGLAMGQGWLGDGR